MQSKLCIEKQHLKSSEFVVLSASETQIENEGRQRNRQNLLIFLVRIFFNYNVNITDLS